MTEYLKITISTTSAAESDLLVAQLAERNFYAFEQLESSLVAYILKTDYRPQELHHLFPAQKMVDVETLQEENWNAKWEKNFTPVVLDSFACVRAPFHESPPGILYDLIISPKMSFGTGHHSTTRLMMKAMQECDFTGKQVMDFGTGTGVLAILAEKMGASHVLAIDYDSWSVENTRENVAANACVKIHVLQESSPPSGRRFGILLANINLNVLTTFAEQLSETLESDGLLILCGFLNADERAIQQTFAGFLLEIKSTFRDGGWSCLVLERPKNETL